MSIGNGDSGNGKEYGGTLILLSAEQRCRDAKMAVRENMCPPLARAAWAKAGGSAASSETRGSVIGMPSMAAVSSVGEYMRSVGWSSTGMQDALAARVGHSGLKPSLEPRTMRRYRCGSWEGSVGMTCLCR